jgi:hypothetical protein
MCKYVLSIALPFAFVQRPALIDDDLQKQKQREYGYLARNKYNFFFQKEVVSK